MEIKIGKTTVSLYSSKETLPIHRFHLFNKMLMKDAEVGCDIDAFNARLNRMHELSAKGLKGQLQKEIENLRQCFYHIEHDFNTKHLAFAVLVERIGKKKYYRHDNDTLVEILTECNRHGMTEEQLSGYLNEVKKKLKLN
jgi:hypothetical protein